MTIELDPMEVTVADGLERVRRDLGKVKDLARSIDRFGQLQPIVINRENELICGGRRLAACILAKRKVLAVYQDTLDPLTMREMELEENIQRKELTPAEECLAIKEIHTLKTSIHGEAVSGRKGGWTLQDTAETIGKTKGNVIEALHLAEMVKCFPELKEAKTKSEIKKAAKGLERIAVVTSALKTMEEKAKTESRYQLFNMDAKDFLLTQPDGKYDIFLTDPPYGIDICNTKGTVSGTGGTDATGIYFKDTKDIFFKVLEYLPAQLYRITKPAAQGYMFFAPEFYQPAVEAFKAWGWIPYVRPIIWTKQNYGHSNQPGLYPVSSYEMCLFIRKMDAKLIKEGQQDYISEPPVVGDAKIHTTEKPVPVIRNLLERIALPGMYVIDPFMGSGSTVETAVQLQLFAVGNDILKECYALAHDRMEGK